MAAAPPGTWEDGTFQGGKKESPDSAESTPEHRPSQDLGGLEIQVAHLLDI